MANILDLLQSQLGDQAISALTNQLGGQASTKQTSTAVDSGIAILMNALSKNAASPQGASALNAALDKDHDGSIMDDLMGYINGTSTVNNTRAANGAGILGHILGSRQGSAVEALTKASGLNQSQSSNLLAKLAPMVLGTLGQQKKSSGIGVSDLAGILSGVAGAANKKVGGNASLLTSFLDSDGDGNLRNEAAGLGMKLLKGLFSRKR